MQRQIRHLFTLAMVSFLPMSFAPESRAAPSLPALQGVAYGAARAALIAAGWTPRLNPPAHGESVDVQNGNGPLFWSRGYHELRSCAGTGSAACRFEFSGEDNTILVVVTNGEEDEGGAYRATVSEVFLDK